MTPPMVLDLDGEWLDDDDEDEDDEEEGLGDLFYRDASTGHYTQIAAIHLPHFIALYDRDEDVLN